MNFIPSLDLGKETAHAGVLLVGPYSSTRCVTPSFLSSRSDKPTPAALKTITCTEWDIWEGNPAQMSLDGNGGL